MDDFNKEIKALFEKYPKSPGYPQAILQAMLFANGLLKLQYLTPC